jgi:hypothetical protein
LSLGVPKMTISVFASIARVEYNVLAFSRAQPESLAAAIADISSA